MSIYEVWAPYGKSVAVRIGDQTFAMQPGQRGWWRVEAPDEAGEDYQFVLDDGQTYPDPRSPWQPAGVHGPSRRVDHSRFAWTDAKWQPRPLSSALIYELHIGTFTPQGTFDAAIERLNELAALGVTHIELMPVNEFPGKRGWGYDGVDLYAPHHAYGGPDGLKRLVDAAHGAGLAVILDVVYNHLGPDGNYLAKFGPYFNSHHRTNWGDAMNFDGPGSDEVRRFFIDNARMWLRDYHMDGLRLDAVHTMFDNSAVHILEQLAQEVRLLEGYLGRNMVLIAESDLNNPRVVMPQEAGGYGLDAQWSDDFHHALHSILTGESNGIHADFGQMEDLATALTNVFVYNRRYSAYRSRTHGRPVANMPFYRFVAFLQNHDQVGNRAQGDRVHATLTPEEYKIGAALVLTSPFVPMLFQGEEWAASSPFLFFTDHQDVNLARAVSEGRQRDFAVFGGFDETVPDPQDEQTFRASQLRWDERAQPRHAEMLAWYRELIALRRRMPGLAAGGLEAPRVRYDEQERWLWMQRAGVSVVCNFGANPVAIPIDDETPRSILLASFEAQPSRKDTLELPPRSVVILSEGNAA